ncbi:unnamed protein product [Oncorhynchus mykiss]|uniref:HtrA serine peptidase 3a n=1 Tax=Oncorhynchus mykiss TaxID=8022 RepID=A0A060Y3T2_ONCMY|nr:unnamed protein product [Oncorhynchus mykiss]
MQVLLLATVLFCVEDFVRAEPKQKCTERCDVSTCPSPSCPMGYVPDRCNCCLVCAQGEGEPCGRKDDLPCGDGLDCKHPAGKRLAKGFCQCKLVHKVCGSDGNTYGNVCQLKAQSRKALQQGLPAINSVQKGPCKINQNKGNIGTSHPTSPRYKFNFIADVVEKIAPAVVHIELFLRHPLFGRNVPLSSGSGFVMSETGLIVTNAHVVSSTTPMSGHQQLKVQMHSGDIYEATIKDIDKKSDIATIKVNSLVRETPIFVVRGRLTLYPKDFWTFYNGTVQILWWLYIQVHVFQDKKNKQNGAKHRQYPRGKPGSFISLPHVLQYYFSDLLQTGCMLLNIFILFRLPSFHSIRLELWSNYNVVDSSSVFSSHHWPHINNFVFTEVRSLKKRFIGIRMLTITSALVEELKQQNPDFPEVTSGIYVHEVVPHSPAQKGGIRDGDIIVKLNGRPLLTTADLQGALTEETTLLLEVRRGNDDLLFNIQPDVIMQ